MEKGADPLNFAASSGDLPRAEERYGSRALRNSYTCDHGGVRRLQSRRESGPWATARKFVKVSTIECAATKGLTYKGPENGTIRKSQSYSPD